MRESVEVASEDAVEEAAAAATVLLEFAGRAGTGEFECAEDFGFVETLSELLLKRPRVVARVVRHLLRVVWERGLVVGSAVRGGGGEGERWRMLSRRAADGEVGNTERKAGSRRGVGAVEIREGFFLRRWGDFGATVAVGEVGTASLSDAGFRRRWMERSERDMILRKGGMRATSF